MRKLFNIIACFLLIVACSKSPKNSEIKEYPYMSSKKASLEGQTKVRFVQELSIGTDDFNNENFYFSLISDFKVDKKNRIYVLDGKSFNIKIFSPDGEFISSFELKKGQGPGEFSKPKCLAVDNDSNIYIGDMDLMKISIFDFDGKLIKTFKTEERPAQLALDNEKNIYLTGFFDYSKKRIHKYNIQSMKKVSSFSSSNKMTKEVALFGEADNIFVDEENKIYFSSFFPYEIRVFSPKQKLINRFSRQAKLFSKKLNRDQVTGALNFVIGSSQILVLNDGKVINILKSRDIAKKKGYFDFDIFDSNGKWLLTFPSTEIGLNWVRLAAVDREGYLYVDSSDPFPQIKKFSMKFEDLNEY
ncbi:MAG: NHL repeat-containing protein [Candidatus Aminicenantales bacterium]